MVSVADLLPVPDRFSFWFLPSALSNVMVAVHPFFDGSLIE